MLNKRLERFLFSPQKKAEGIRIFLPLSKLLKIISPIYGKITEHLFYPEKLVVLADAVSPAGGTGLYLASAQRNSDIRDCRILSFA